MSRPPNPGPRICETRSSAFSIVRPDALTGPLRHFSSWETRSPSGTFVSESSSARCPALSRLCRVSHSRWFASSRTCATSPASVVTPGSSTSCPRSQRIASAKIAFGPSPVVQARASNQSRSSFSRSSESCSPNSALISSACSNFVLRRSTYRPTQSGSAIFSCPAR